MSLPIILGLYLYRHFGKKRASLTFSSVGYFDGITGNWKARVQVGGAVFEKALTIETVKPNRLKINLNFGIDKIVAGSESVYGNLEVKWLHGAIAKNLRAVFDVMLSLGRMAKNTPSALSFAPISMGLPICCILPPGDKSLICIV